VKKNKARYLFIAVVLFLFTEISTYAQQLNLTLNRDYLWSYDNYLNNKAENFQTFIKPYKYVDFNNVNDSSIIVSAFPIQIAIKANRIDLSKTEEKKKINLRIQPLIVANIGYQATSTSRLTNDLAIGANISANIGNKFSFNFKALGGKAIYNSYLDSIIKQTNVVPGLGYAYSNKDSIRANYAYQYFTGYASYSPNKVFNFQIGRDKHFWGDGYRSLFLSDAAAPYSFLKITTNIWKLSYVNLFTAMKDVTHPSGLKKDWKNKYATFHYLGWNATKRIQIGIFESIVWQGADSTRNRGYDVNYLNPVLFYRPTEYSLGSSDNAFLGLNFKIKLFKKQQVYGQLLLDEFLLKEIKERSGWWANKYAFQLGIKSFDLFKIKNLHFQTEYNYVRPYTYAHGSVQQNYSHMNQPLAHPLGANFMESVSFVNYRIKRFYIETKVLYSVYGDDSSTTNYGKNIFISYVSRPNDFGNFTTQGFQTHLIITSLRVAYILDTKMNLKAEFTVSERIEKQNNYTKQIPFVSIGIRTDLCNLYDDF